MRALPGPSKSNPLSRICLDHVYISFDIDGLDPKLCPNTGTPVPGGFEFEEAALSVLKRYSRIRSRTIIGIDLNEVAPGDDEWDANVGARLLWRLCNLDWESGLKTSIFAR